MPTNSILKLKAVFANLPMKGLFFWEALLFLNNDEYQKVLEDNFIKTIDGFPQDEDETKKHYQKILKNFRTVRKNIFTDLNIRQEVEGTRKELILEAAHEHIIGTINDNLDKQESEK